MSRSLKIAVSCELLKLTNIELRLSQFSSKSGVQCDIIKISNQDDTDRMKKDIEQCEVAFIMPWYFTKIGGCLPLSLKWIQTGHAGVEQLNFLDPDIKDRLQQCTITRGGSGYGTIMAEYTICAIIAMERNIPTIIRKREERSWLQTAMGGFRSLHEVSVGILGLGEIGKEVARMCSSHGMTVYGMKTSLEPVNHVDKVYTSDQLTDLLQASDYVCSILPSTSKTKGLLSNGVLKVCETKPIKFINIGRGDIIDEKSLVEALNNGWIENAFLDVFETEPLPPESPLWSLENVTITPHVSGFSVHEIVPNALLENLENYINLKKLKNSFSWEKEY